MKVIVGLCSSCLYPLSPTPIRLRDILDKYIYISQIYLFIICCHAVTDIWRFRLNSCLIAPCSQIQGVSINTLMDVSIIVSSSPSPSPGLRSNQFHHFQIKNNSNKRLASKVWWCNSSPTTSNRKNKVSVNLAVIWYGIIITYVNF